jgi:hypothetical protein
MAKSLWAIYLLSALAVGAHSMAFPLGIRLSNPGNIKRTTLHWEGMTRLQDDPVFIRFNSPHYGIRALVRILINYKDLHDCETITMIMHRYAPPSENKTTAYIRDVSARSGYFPNEVIDLHDINVLVNLAQAIVIHENGLAPVVYPAAWYEEDVYYRAAESALKED